MQKRLLTLLSAVAALMACSAPAAPPTPTSIWVPTATAQPATATRAPTSTVAPTATSAPTSTPPPAATAAPTNTPAPTATRVYARRPEYTGPGAQKDAKGRVLGGGLPIVNYSPTMVTGKPCPRVTQWEYDTFTATDGTRHGAPNNPCIVQNAIDDYVKIAWALPYHADLDTMEETARTYDTNPELKGRILDTWANGYLANSEYRTAYGYSVCEPLMLAMLNPNPRIEIDWQTGRVLFLELIRIPLGFSDTKCRGVSYKDGALMPEVATVKIADREKNGYTMFRLLMFWDKEQQLWRFGQYQPNWTKSARETREIYTQAGLK